MNTPADQTDPHGYRLTPAAGVRIRSDIVDVYIFQRAARAPEHTHYALDHSARATRMDSDGGDFNRPAVYFLQLLRASEPLANSWHPIMGHMEAGETALQCMRRELIEEVGLRPGDHSLLHLWALEQVHPFFIPALDTIVFSPRFAAEIRPGWTPRLNHEHTAFRWVHQRDVPSTFMWPGQKAACREITDDLLRSDSVPRPTLA